MNPLTLLANAYLRWRHSHGFGVHSPFAYNLVTMAVRPGKYGYYGYELIDRVILTPGKDMTETCVVTHVSCCVFSLRSEAAGS